MESEMSQWGWRFNSYLVWALRNGQRACDYSLEIYDFMLQRFLETALLLIVLEQGAQDS